MIVTYFIDFWLDYAASVSKTIKKHEKDPSVSVFLDTTLTMALNLNSVLVLVCYFFSINFFSREHYIITGLIMFIANYIWVKDNSLLIKEVVNSRIPKYPNYIYRLWTFFSVVVFFLICYLVVPGQQ